MTRAAWFIVSICTSMSLSAAVITTAATGQQVRFMSPEPTAQIRVKIDGVLDSDWKDGNVFDWRPEALADGTYHCVVMVKDLEGNIAQKESAITVQGDKVLIEDREAKVTLLAHDGSTGEIVSTSGDLKFSFGDVLAGKEKERMRLTADGDLLIEGRIRATKGIELPDGTVVASAEALARRAPQSRANASPSAAPSTARLTPRSNFTPGFQFVVNDTGVMVGTTNPAFRLDVTGEINTATQYDIGAFRFAHAFGNGSTFTGFGSGNLTLSGLYNTGVGVNTLQALTTGSANTATGMGALKSDTTGYDNTANGVNALSSNDTGHDNTAIGRNTLFNNTGGNDNTAVGHSALINNTVGGENTGIGAAALQSNTNGFSNTAVGSSALLNNPGGGANTAVGAGALRKNTGDGNVAVGAAALENTTIASNTIAIGNFAGFNLTTGDYNIDIGNLGVGGENHTIRIGDPQDRAFIAGIYGVTPAGAASYVVIDSNGQLGTIASSRVQKFDIADIGDITDGLMQLRPVRFRYLAHGEDAPLQYGLIAEEVAEVYPEMVTRKKDGEVDTVMYQFLSPMLLNEVQKEHRTIEQQQKTIERLAATIDLLTRRLDALERTR